MRQESPTDRLARLKYRQVPEGNPSVFAEISLDSLEIPLEYIIQMAIINNYFHADAGELFANDEFLLVSHVFQSANVVSCLGNLVCNVSGGIS